MQGLTLDEIVVDMKGGRFSRGQAYVALSHVLTGLFQLAMHCQDLIIIIIT